MKHRWLNYLFIAATMGLIVFIAFSNNDLADAWGALFTLKPLWLLFAFMGWLGYMGFDMMGLYYFLRKQKYPISVGFATYVTLMGFFYCNITPGSSGGQPMQVYYLTKRKIPVPISTSALSIKFLSLQIMMVIITTLLWVFNAGFVNEQLPRMKWFIYIGYGLNALSIPLILLVALHRPLVQAIILFFVRVGAKLHLIKRPEEKIVHIDAGMDMYHMSILRLMKYPRRIIGQLLFAGLSLLSLMSIPLSVYHAFDLSGAPWYHILTISFLLFISASYTPLPGASGAQEGGFLIFFRGLFTQGTIGLALLVWRFFGYYLFLLMGVVISIISSVRDHFALGRQSTDDPADTASPDGGAADITPPDGSSADAAPPDGSTVPANPNQT